jgi:aryl-alcohol dehydrogenase-like predicted oxidoreductase
VRSSPRSGTDGGGPIRSASTAGLGRCGRAGRNAPFRPAEKRGRGALRLRFMTEQPPYSLLVRGIDADVLPVAEQFGMGCAAVVVGSPI